MVTDELCSMTDLRHAIREWIFQSGISRATGVRYGRARAPDLQGALSRDQRTARKMTGCCYRVSTLRRLSTTSALVRSAGTRSRRAAQAIIPMISRRAESPRPAATRPGATGAMPTRRIRAASAEAAALIRAVAPADDVAVPEAVMQTAAAYLQGVDRAGPVPGAVGSLAVGHATKCVRCGRGRSPFRAGILTHEGRWLCDMEDCARIAFEQCEEYGIVLE